MINYEIQSIQIKDHYAIVNELMAALHENERMLNEKTADWNAIQHQYMQHLQYCQENYYGTFLLAMVQQIPIGFIFGYIDEQDESNFETGSGDDLYVSEGYVLPAYRKQGVYKALNDQFENSYSDFSIRRIVRYTLISNSSMQRWLQSQGYKPVRLVYEKWR